MRRLKQESSLLEEYDNIFKEQLCQGIVEKVDNPVEESVPGVTHYLPHQAVVREEAITTKVRVVYDASAKVKPKSPSLNDCVYAGPSLSTEILKERAPWWGGYYERMVQLVKRSLRKILGNARLTFEELTTVLTEVEGSLNSRPLTYVYSELSDGEPLTPSHLVIGRRIATLPDPEELSESEDDCKAVARRQRYLSQLLQHFWKRWNREYLADLREFHRNTTNNTGKKVEVGEIVLVEGEDLPRSQWKIGFTSK